MEENKSLIEYDLTKDMFVSNGLDEFINKIKVAVSTTPRTADTKEHRKEIASTAFKIARAKKEVERVGKEAAQEAQEIINSIRKERDTGVNYLQILQDDIRKPLTEWEETEKKRIDFLEKTILEIKKCGDEVKSNWINISVEKMEEYLSNLTDCPFPDFLELQEKANYEIDSAINKIKTSIEFRKKHEETQAEVKRLKDEALIREQELLAIRNKEKLEAEAEAKRLKDEALIREQEILAIRNKEILELKAEMENAIGQIDINPSKNEETLNVYYTSEEQIIMLYNAALFNEWAKQNIFNVHKSLRNSSRDGERCFGGKCFIVMANLPTGQISHFYPIEYFDLFKCQEKTFCDEWDLHSSKDVIQRLFKYLK